MISPPALGCYETRHRLFPIAWGERVELNWLCFSAFRSPPMCISLYDLFAEFGVPKTLDFLNAFCQLAYDVLYLPLTSFGLEVDGIRLLHFVFEGEVEAKAKTHLSVPDECATCEAPCAFASAWDETNPTNGMDTRVCRLRFQSDVALVSVQAGEERRSAEYAAALGAPLVIPHHFRAYGKLPPADLDGFAGELVRLAPDTTLRVLDVMETIVLRDHGPATLENNAIIPPCVNYHGTIPVGAGAEKSTSTAISSKIE